MWNGIEREVWLDVVTAVLTNVESSLAAIYFVFLYYCISAFLNFCIPHFHLGIVTAVVTNVESSLAAKSTSETVLISHGTNVRAQQILEQGNVGSNFNFI